MICFLINKGTSAHDFLHFITGLLARLQPGTRYTFLWDNLGSHHSNMVVNAVYAAGHRIVPRPCYYPADGPSEYMFNLLECHLNDNMYRIHTENDLIQAIGFFINNLTQRTVVRTFRKLGY